MGSTKSFDGVRRKYTIRKIKPQGWVAARNINTDEERLIYSLPLHGPGYDTDNRAGWNEIQNFYIGTTLYE